MAATTSRSKPSYNVPSVLDKLKSDFPKQEVKQREAGFGKKLDYISIDSTLNRLLDTVGLDYEFTRAHTDLRLVNDGFLALVSGYLVVDGKDHYGVGADFDKKDPDKAVKTALAEAIKKAGHQVGIALYLWDEAKRDEITAFRSLRELSLGELQKAVLAKVGRPAIAALSKEEQRNKEALIKLLETS